MRGIPTLPLIFVARARHHSRSLRSRRSSPTRCRTIFGQYSAWRFSTGRTSPRSSAAASSRGPRSDRGRPVTRACPETDDAIGDHAAGRSGDRAPDSPTTSSPSSRTRRCCRCSAFSRSRAAPVSTAASVVQVSRSVLHDDLPLHRPGAGSVDSPDGSSSGWMTRGSSEATDEHDRASQGLEDVRQDHSRRAGRRPQCR